NDLLQVGHRGQVSRQLDDAGGAAPVGTEAARIDRGDEGRVEVGGGVVAGESVARCLRQAGVGVAHVQREHLVGEADTDVPGVVARLGNTGGEDSAGTCAI